MTRGVPGALLLGVAAISFAAILFRLAAPTPPLVAAGVRLLVAGALLAPWSIALARRRNAAVFRYGALAGLAYAVHFGAWVASLTLTSVTASVTLVTTTPLVLALASLGTGRDRPTRRVWGALGLGAAGVAVLGGADVETEGALLGDALALLGAMAMALYLYVAREATLRVPGMSVMGFQGVATGAGAVLLLGSAAASGAPPLPPSGEALAFLVLAALLPQLVGHGLLTWCLRATSPTVVGIATLGEPVGASLLAWWWLDERPTGATLLGASLVVAGVALALTAGRGKLPPERPGRRAPPRFPSPGEAERLPPG